MAAVRRCDSIWEIIVVDDASRDNSLEILKGYPDIRVVARSENGGFSAACNDGIKNAKNDILFFLNTDVELSENIFQYFSIHFDKDDTFAVTITGYHYRTGKLLDGGKIGYWKRGNLRTTENYYVDGSNEGIYESFFAVGAYFFADRKKVLLLDGFDEALNPYIFEETDLCYRALKRGWKIYYEPRCVARHDHSFTIKSTSSARRLKVISLRNRFIFTWKNIHSRKLLFSHILYLIGQLLLIRISVWKALVMAIRKWNIIMDKRAVEKKMAVRTDEEILDYYGYLKQKTTSQADSGLIH